MNLHFTNGTIVTPEKIISSGVLSIENDTISHVGQEIQGKNGITIKIPGLLVFPGIIDGHDHLLGTYMPRVGDRRPYRNWLEWDNDLKSSPHYKERQNIESHDLYLLGTYRHLITGVTSVQDHIPHFVRDLFNHNPAVRLVDGYKMAHSVTSFALAWGNGIRQEHEEAVRERKPFITHCSEGYDTETRNSVVTLEKNGAVSEHTVLIHGIAFSDADIDLLAKRKSNVVWCPVSNLYMFNDTAPIKKLLDAGINVMLGTDSPMSGSVNIFEEMLIAKKYYWETYGEDLADETIFNMLTANASRGLFRDDLGSLEKGKKADFIIVRGNVNLPFQSFVRMNYSDIMLVVIDGKVRYGDAGFMELFEELDIPFQKVKVAGSEKLVNGDILGLLKRIRNAVGYRKELPFLPVEPWE